MKEQFEENDYIKLYQFDYSLDFAGYVKTVEALT